MSFQLPEPDDAQLPDPIDMLLLLPPLMQLRSA
eukprot:COSAG05_NODE_16587_length_342_cov_1.189300_2_plen_32_part_01